MEWWIVLAIMLGALILLFTSGIPVAFAFLCLNMIGTIIWMGGINNLNLIVISAYSGLARFSLVAAPLFVGMGMLLFHTGLARLLIDCVGKWIGKTRGSLSLVAIATGTIFATMSGSSISGVALLGSTLVPEMRNRGYAKQLALGPILGAGGLAMIIPPSAVGVILASIANVSVAGVLMGAYIPGVMLAAFYIGYILIRARLQPALTPAFEAGNITWGDKLKSLLYILPLGSLIFLVMGLIFLGVATPSESAALGVVGALILAIIYRKINWASFKKSMTETMNVTAMTFMIIGGSFAFSQILAYTGVAAKLVAIISGLNTSPLVIIFIMQIIMIFLGCFIESVPIIMIAVPIFFPILRALNIDLIWFSVIMLVNLEMGGITPPFGILNFVLKGVAPEYTMGDIIKAGLPFMLLELVLIFIMVFVPSVVTWLPGLIRPV